MEDTQLIVNSQELGGKICEKIVQANAEFWNFSSHLQTLHEYGQQEEHLRMFIRQHLQQKLKPYVIEGKIKIKPKRMLTFDTHETVRRLFADFGTPLKIHFDVTICGENKDEGVVFEAYCCKVGIEEKSIAIGNITETYGSVLDGNMFEDFLFPEEIKIEEESAEKDKKEKVSVEKECNKNKKKRKKKKRATSHTQGKADMEEEEEVEEDSTGFEVVMEPRVVTRGSTSVQSSGSQIEAKVANHFKIKVEPKVDTPDIAQSSSQIVVEPVAKEKAIRKRKRKVGNLPHDLELEEDEMDQGRAKKLGASTNQISAQKMKEENELYGFSTAGGPVGDFLQFIDETTREETLSDVQIYTRNLRYARKNIENIARTLKRNEKYTDVSPSGTDKESIAYFACKHTCQRHCPPYYDMAGLTGRPPKIGDPAEDLALSDDDDDSEEESVLPPSGPTINH